MSKLGRKREGGVPSPLFDITAEPVPPGLKKEKILIFTIIVAVAASVAVYVFYKRRKNIRE